MKLKFLGAVGTVTGSKYLLDLDCGKRILIDCGLFQGKKELRLRNWTVLPVDPLSIDYVLVTHAHLDHCGYLPILVKNGFRGKIYCTSPTIDLCEIILKDSGHLQEEEAYKANKYRYSKHKVALPLYTVEDAEAVIEKFCSIKFYSEFRISNGVSFKFNYAGHMLGAASVVVQEGEKSILFSGDLGVSDDPIMNKPDEPEWATCIVMESTYGDRIHENKMKVEELFAGVINRVMERKGMIIIPAFAVGRAQLIMYYLNKMKREKKIASDIPVFLDSPMALNASEIFKKYVQYHKLGEIGSCEMFDGVKFVNSVEESKKLDVVGDLCGIIISASGMAVGGRVLHHIERFASDSKNAIVFCGYQAEETRGARILNGEKKIKMFGKFIPINAEVANLSGPISAHADSNELTNWIGNIGKRKKFLLQHPRIFLTHGSETSSKALQAKILNELKMNCEIPAHEQEALT